MIPMWEGRKNGERGWWDQECSFGRCQEPNPARQGSSQSGECYGVKWEHGVLWFSL